MTDRTAHSITRDTVLATLRGAMLADAAGVTPAVWASTASPRVLAGTREGYLAGLHRGRLPAVEVWQEDESWTREAVDGGTHLATWAMRIHVPGPGLDTADALARQILAAAFALIRGDAYQETGGGEAAEALSASPYGFALVARFRLALSYGRDTFEFTREATP